ncbi:hypothetical protein ACQWKP_23500, partial [Salmonella enterica subsp. enterica serovar Infantis]
VLVRDVVNQRHRAELVPRWGLRRSDLEQRLRVPHEGERLRAEFCKRQGNNCDIDEREALHPELAPRIASLSARVSSAREQPR